MPDPEAMTEIHRDIIMASQPGISPARLAYEIKMAVFQDTLTTQELRWHNQETELATLGLTARQPI